MTAEEIRKEERRIASLPGMPLISDGDVNKVIDNLKRILKVQKDAQALAHQIGQEGPTMNPLNYGSLEASKRLVEE